MSRSKGIVCTPHLKDLEESIVRSLQLRFGRPVVLIQTSVDLLNEPKRDRNS